MNVRTLTLTLGLGMLTAAGCAAKNAAVAKDTQPTTAKDLPREFIAPPESARPWVYWFWLNGNITREGITADLEAMRRVGIGGVLIMEVDQGVPVGPVDFLSPQWRELFKHAVAEAQRLGLEINMNDDAGWNGSGGPWITPDRSMQQVIWGEANIRGPQHYEAVLPRGKEVAAFYRDIAVLAFPTPGSYRIDHIAVKAGYQVGDVPPPATQAVTPEMVIPRQRLVDLGSKMDSTGRLAWDVPPGDWTIMRFGHTSTGAQNAPAPATGRGLECDKLSKAGIEANFAGMMAKLVGDVGPAAGKTLVTTHIDSWENGSQNWTAQMAEEFRKRRGYDLMNFLPVFSGRVVESPEVSERFLWDLRQTISELVVENYAGHMRSLANQHGLKLSIEAYGGPCQHLPYGGRADEPMCEFWMGGMAIETVKEMASAAHTYGKPIVGAESFTAGDQERWLEHPGSIKSLGDQAFCDGVNRFVFHRYAMQPWLDRVPGMTMGPWGLHYERTQTWWEWSGLWHEYLARCQVMLRQGHFVADICYLQPEGMPQKTAAARVSGYDYDLCSPEVLLTRMAVKDGRLVLPDGMSYRLLVLPDGRTMTPELLQKLRDLTSAGATVVGPPPIESPSLSGFPACDDQVKQLARALWGDCDGEKLTEHSLGKGRVVWGPTPQQVLSNAGVAADFASSPPGLRYIHRVAEDRDIYFVSNPLPHEVDAVCRFRVTGKTPAFWWPESGRIEAAAMFEEKDGRTNVSVPLEPSGSVFVVFRTDKALDPVVSVTRDGKTVRSLVPSVPRIRVENATYGVLDDPARTRDVRAIFQSLVDAGQYSFPVSQMARGDDPAYGVVKMLVVELSADGQQAKVSGTDPQTITLSALQPPGPRTPELHRDADGTPWMRAWGSGQYEVAFASGRRKSVTAMGLPPAQEVPGTWDVQFERDRGAPAEGIRLEKLISLSDHSDASVKYFSGIATYSKTIHLTEDMFAKARRIELDLGQVAVMAQVRLNGKPIATLWKPPYRVDITDAARAGENALEIKVANLWPNRLIGDEQLPLDSDRNPNGTLKAWPRWLLEKKPSPTGRYTFATWNLWKKDSPLPPSGLIGPVTIEIAGESTLR